MHIRYPAAPHFYGGDVQRQTDRFLKGFLPPRNVAAPVGGIVPHAGWMFSGRTAARVFATLRELNPPDTVILFGAVHNAWRLSTSALFPEGAWNTPIGDVQVDESLAGKVLSECGNLLSADTSVHEGEHSIEVQVPFIRHLLPGAKILPIAVLPDENAAAIGERAASAVRTYGKTVAAVGSTDLTHYGENYGFAPAGIGPDAKKWMEENDRKIIDPVLALETEKIVKIAAELRNACGAGAITAAAAFSRELGASKGTLLEYVTSFDISPDPVFTMAVGYAGIIFD